jgi:hypothetical protein
MILSLGEAASGQTVAIARLEGRVGFISGKFNEPAFDATSLKEVLDKAASQKFDAVILEVESGGGIVDIGLEITKLLRERQATGTKIVAWYGMAGSAASWIPFSCKDAVTKPTGLCGGSVICSTDASGKLNPVEAKFASFSIAEVKNASAAAGRPELLVDAIFEQPREVWLTSAGALAGQRPAGDDGAKCIDSSAGVLNMDAATAVAIGFAKGPAADRDAAARAVGLEPVKWVDLTPVVAGRNSRLAARDQTNIKSARAWQLAVEKLISTIMDAIQATHAPATEYESGRAPSSDARIAGTRARRALGEQLERVRASADAIKPDEAIDPAAQFKLLFEHHGAILERTARIRTLLEGRSTKAAMDALREIDRLLDEIKKLAVVGKEPG